MFYEQKRIYSHEVSKSRNFSVAAFFYIDKEVCSSFCSRSTFADKNVP